MRRYIDKRAAKASTERHLMTTKYLEKESEALSLNRAIERIATREKLAAIQRKSKGLFFFVSVSVNFVFQSFFISLYIYFLFVYIYFFIFFN